jgi:hypothetical protein
MVDVWLCVVDQIGRLLPGRLNARVDGASPAPHTPGSCLYPLSHNIRPVHDRYDRVSACYMLDFC